MSFYGWPRGQSYVTRNYAKMLIPDYEIYIMQLGDNRILPEFELDANIMSIPNAPVDPQVFKMWIEANKLDAVVFNEYNQWKNDGNNLVAIAKECGVKTYGYLVWEKWEGKEAYSDYDRLLAPTVTMERFFRMNRVRNFTYVPVSVDLSEFPKKDMPDNDKFIFFHPGGFGGIHERKNTKLVVDAFLDMDRDDAELIITSQLQFDDVYKKDLEDAGIKIIDNELSREELIEYYYKADCTILPSKWETVGLPIQESLAAGTPVITSNAPPMNEFIVEGTNGYLVNCDMEKYPDIAIYSCDISHGAIRNKMVNVMNKMLYTVLARNSRYVAETLYDNDKNRKYFLDLLEKDLK